MRFSVNIKDNEIKEIKEIEGLKIRANKKEDVIFVEIIADKKIKEPVRLCFGIHRDNIVQKIKLKIVLNEDSELEMYSYCSFIESKKLVHLTESEILLKKNSKLRYKEIHEHNDNSDISIKTVSNVYIGENSSYFIEFDMTNGKTGNCEIISNVEIDKKGQATLLTKTFAKFDDRVYISENVRMNGEESSCLIKTRGVAKDNSKIKMVLGIEGNSPYTKGHIDCSEIIENDAVVESIPLIKVRDSKSRVTHEAAIGSVDKKQLETLMAKGLDEEEAIEIIVKGMIS